MSQRTIPASAAAGAPGPQPWLDASRTWLGRRPLPCHSAGMAAAAPGSRAPESPSLAATGPGRSLCSVSGLGTALGGPLDLTRRPGWPSGVVLFCVPSLEAAAVVGPGPGLPGVWVAQALFRVGTLIDPGPSQRDSSDRPRASQTDSDTVTLGGGRTGTMT